MNAIENVKRKLEDGEAIETDEANDPSNPFSKRGETKKRTGKSKVVSRIAEHLFWITYIYIFAVEVKFPKTNFYKLCSFF